MKPPICEVCGKESFQEGGLVYFVRTKNDEEWHRLAEEEGLVGHPPNAAWFCGVHIQMAELHADKTIGEALGKIFSKSDPPGKETFLTKVKKFFSGEEE